MHFYLTTDTQYVPAKTVPLTIDLARDGTVSFVDRGEELEYEQAFAAMGGDEGSLLKLFREIEDDLVNFFLQRDLVSRRVIATIVKQAVERLMRNVEEFDLGFVRPYRLRFENRSDDMVIGTKIVAEMEDRARDMFMERPDLTVNQYGLYCRTMQTLSHKLYDIVADHGPAPMGHLSAAFVLGECGRAAYHVNVLRSILCPERALFGKGESLRTEELLQLGDFLDATEAERAA